MNFSLVNDHIENKILSFEFYTKCKRIENYEQTIEGIDIVNYDKTNNIYLNTPFGNEHRINKITTRYLQLISPFTQSALLYTSKSAGQALDQIHTIHRHSIL